MTEPKPISSTIAIKTYLNHNTTREVTNKEILDFSKATEKDERRELAQQAVDALNALQAKGEDTGGPYVLKA